MTDCFYYSCWCPTLFGGVRLNMYIDLARQSLPNSAFGLAHPHPLSTPSLAIIILTIAWLHSKHFSEKGPPSG